MWIWRGSFCLELNGRMMELKINELNELIYLNKIQINIYLEYNIVIKFQISNFNLQFSYYFIKNFKYLLGFNIRMIILYNLN